MGNQASCYCEENNSPKEVGVENFEFYGSQQKFKSLDLDQSESLSTNNSELQSRETSFTSQSNSTLFYEEKQRHNNSQQQKKISTISEESYNSEISQNKQSLIISGSKIDISGMYRSKTDQIVQRSDIQMNKSEQQKNEIISLDDSIINYNITSDLDIDEDDMLISLQTSMEQITKNIWIGNKASAGYSASENTEKSKQERQKAKQTLNDKKITQILVCCENYQKFQDQEFTYHQFQLPDNPSFDLKEAIKKASQVLEEIEKNDEIAIVHCSAGASRSASIVVGYLMKKYKKRFEVARNYVLSKRNCINVSNFEKNLKEWEQQIFEGVENKKSQQQ